MGFFILSGFIISEALDVFYKKRVFAFLGNRLLRLIPPYFVALLFSIFAHLIIISNFDPKYFDYPATPEGIFSLRNLFGNALLPFVWYGLDTIALEPVYPFVRYVWAVSVEWLFYIVIAFFVFRWGDNRSRGVFAFFLAMLSSLIYKISGSIWFYPLTFASYFLAGVCLYFYLRNRTILPFLGFLLSLIFCFIHFYVFAGQTVKAAMSGLAVVTIALSLIPLSKVKVSPYVQEIDRKLGDLSYPVYLNHYVITILFLSLLNERSVFVIVACVAVCIALSWLLANLVEPITREVRDRLRGAKVG